MKQREKNKISKPTSPVKLTTNNNWLAYLAIVTLTLILYGSTCKFDYALDDLIVIQQNSFTKSGFSGIGDILTNDNFSGAFGKEIKHLPGSRYRPLSLITFAIECQFFDLNPHFSHFINMLLYALTGLLIFIVLKALLNNKPPGAWYLSIPFITAVLFISHPVHTEVVSNIKGRDEILALLFSLAALYYSIRYFDTKKKSHLVSLFIFLFLALLSKENAIVFFAVIPLTLYYFRDFSIRKDYTVILPIILAVTFFLVIRQLVVGGMKTGAEKDLLNNPFIDATLQQKYATIFYTLGFYIKLLLFPSPLTYDYYPYYIPLINFSDLRAIIPMIVYVVLAFAAFYGLQKKSLYSFLILFFLIPLLPVSNLLFNVGVFMAERFIYISSLAFCMALAFIATRYVPNASSGGISPRLLRSFEIPLFLAGGVGGPTGGRPRWAPLLGLLILVGLYSFKTVDRNRAWENNETLLLTDVKTSHESAKSNFDAAHLLEQIGDTASTINQKAGYYSSALNYALQCYKIYPDLTDNLMVLANMYYKYERNYDSIVYYYKRILIKHPFDDKVYNNLHYFFQYDTNAEYQVKVWEDIYHYNPDNYYVNNDLGYLYGKYRHDFDKGIYYLEKAVKSNTKGNSVSTNMAHSYNDLAVYWFMKNDYNKARDNYQKAVEIMPNNPDFLNNLGSAYSKLGDTKNAEEYFAKAQALMLHK